MNNSDTDNKLTFDLGDLGVESSRFGKKKKKANLRRGKTKPVKKESPKKDSKNNTLETPLSEGGSPKHRKPIPQNNKSKELLSVKSLVSETEPNSSSISKRSLSSSNSIKKVTLTSEVDLKKREDPS